MNKNDTYYDSGESEAGWASDWDEMVAEGEADDAINEAMGTWVLVTYDYDAAWSNSVELF